MALGKQFHGSVESMEIQGVQGAYHEKSLYLPCLAGMANKESVLLCCRGGPGG